MAQGPRCFLLEKAPGIKIAKQQAAPSGAWRRGREEWKEGGLPPCCLYPRETGGGGGAVRFGAGGGGGEKKLPGEGKEEMVRSGLPGSMEPENLEE